MHEYIQLVDLLAQCGIASPNNVNFNLSRSGYPMCRTVLYRYCPVPVLSCTGTVLYRHCPVPALSRIGTVLYRYCPVSILSCTGTVLYRYCPVPALSCNGTVLYRYCPVPALSCTGTVLYRHCPVPDVQASLDHGGEDRKVVDDVVSGQIQAPQLSELNRKKTKVSILERRSHFSWPSWKSHLEIAASRYM